MHGVFNEANEKQKIAATTYSSAQIPSSKTQAFTFSSVFPWFHFQILNHTLWGGGHEPT